MTRGLGSPLLLAMLGASVRVAWLVDLEFDNHIYLYSGNGFINWDNKVWQGNGWLRPITVIQENADLAAAGLMIELGGATSELMALVLSQTKRSRLCSVYLASLDASDAIIGTPYLAFLGKFSNTEIVDSNEETVVRISYESAALDLRASRSQKYTNDNHQSRYPGDRGFEYVKNLADWSGSWIVPEAKSKDESRKRTSGDKKK